MHESECELVWPQGWILRDPGLNEISLKMWTVFVHSKLIERRFSRWIPLFIWFSNSQPSKNISKFQLQSNDVRDPNISLNYSVNIHKHEQKHSSHTISFLFSTNTLSFFKKDITRISNSKFSRSSDFTSMWTIFLFLILSSVLVSSAKFNRR